MLCRVVSSPSPWECLFPSSWVEKEAVLCRNSPFGTELRLLSRHLPDTCHRTGWLQSYGQNLVYIIWWTVVGCAILDSGLNDMPSKRSDQQKGPSYFRLADGKTWNASKFPKVPRASAALYTWGGSGTARGKGSLPTCGGPIPEITTRTSAAAPSAVQAPTSPAYAAQATTSPSAAQAHGRPAATQSAKSPGAVTQQRRVQPPRKRLPPERYGCKV
ncbi:hypothetical protein HPB51_027096 [Rhipicephalus microplus]|uniref:Uncharacterized protein n=1 Tax=Rhipicephalus microplus TaxID=6941 RepID=A0A9J6D143_RHIMP|nr:hypothetical protein HPB51_027096 [Rhipicephalus microplus]